MEKLVVEFTADGKITYTVTLDEGKEFKVAGTYKVEGNKIIQTLKHTTGEETSTLFVTKLTDDKLVGEEDGLGGKFFFKKIKTEKKDK
jgi:uncharacterized protein (TIGR03066 family)